MLTMEGNKSVEKDPPHTMAVYRPPCNPCLYFHHTGSFKLPQIHPLGLQLGIFSASIFEIVDM